MDRGRLRGSSSNRHGTERSRSRSAAVKSAHGSESEMDGEDAGNKKVQPYAGKRFSGLLSRRQYCWGNLPAEAMEEGLLLGDPDVSPPCLLCHVIYYALNRNDLSFVFMF